MKIKQKMTMVLFGVGILATAALYTQPVYANHTPNHADNQAERAEVEKTCGGVETSIITCTQGKGTTTTNNGVWGLLLLTLNIMTAGVGILAVGGIVYGSALYASSADKPEQAKQGMQFIKNVVIGLVAYGLMYIMLNFLIPGGIFK